MTRRNGCLVSLLARLQPTCGSQSLVPLDSASALILDRALQVSWPSVTQSTSSYDFFCLIVRLSTSSPYLTPWMGPKLVRSCWVTCVKSNDWWRLYQLEAGKTQLDRPQSKSFVQEPLLGTAGVEVVHAKECQIPSWGDLWAQRCVFAASCRAEVPASLVVALRWRQAPSFTSINNGWWAWATDILHESVVGSRFILEEAFVSHR